MGRSYSAVIAAVLLFLYVCSMVPSLMMGTQASSHEDMLGTMNNTDDETDYTDVELNMMHFSASASSEDGIYYVARRGVDAIAYFGESGVWYVAGDTLFRLEFPGSARVVPIGEEPTGSATNYMIGNDPSRWKTGLTDCAVLRYADIYPGIDLVYRVVNGHLKYEFVVAPHADPSLIQMRYPDADMVEVYDDSVTISKDGVEIADTGLKAFQECSDVNGVECVFCSDETATIGLCMGRYSPLCELTIDPLLLMYSSYLGGLNHDYGYAIAVENGFAYVAGRTSSSTFPTVNAYDSSLNSPEDCFVTKFAADRQTLIYSTYLGSTGPDYLFGIAVENGFAYVTGWTESSNFPTVNAYDSSPNGVYDCFVTKIAADGGSLVYSTYLGGTGFDYAYGIAVEGGSAYITGYTLSSGFPTVNAYDSSYNAYDDCFVTKFAADGQSLVYSTFLGGSDQDHGFAIAVENGSVYVTGYTMSSNYPTVNAYDSTLSGGSDAFVTKFSTSGQSLVYSTYLGGSGGDTSWSSGIAVENGFAYVTSFPVSTDFPTVNAYDSTHNGGDDSFVTKFAADGQSLVYSTFLGGTGHDHIRGIAVENGLAHVTGETYSSNFPTVNAYDSTRNGTVDCFVARLAVDGRSLVYSTLLGGTDDDFGEGIAAENGSVYVTGHTESTDFPTVNAYDSTNNDGYSECFLAVMYDDTDTDMDGLEDWMEAYYGTNPFCIDSDNDNFLDGYEAAYGSDPTDPMSYPAMPQAWYDTIYEDLNGNATLIQQVISWLDGNHTAIETLFFFLEGNASLLIQTVNAVDANSDQLDLLAALVTHNADALSSLNVTHIGDIAQIRAVLDMLGVTVGDTDYDGLDDLDEVALGTDIQCIDTDCDNLNDAYEVKIGTDPTDDDSDNDTFLDGAEVLAGTNPLDALDYPGHTGTTTVPPMGIEIIVIAGAAGCVGLLALSVLMRRRTGTKAPS